MKSTKKGRQMASKDIKFIYINVGDDKIKKLVRDMTPAIQELAKT